MAPQISSAACCKSILEGKGELGFPLVGKIATYIREVGWVGAGMQGRLVYRRSPRAKEGKRTKDPTGTERLRLNDPRVSILTC